MPWVTPYLFTVRPKPEQVQASGTHSDFLLPIGFGLQYCGSQILRWLGRRSFRRGGSQILRGVLGCFWRENTKMKDYEGHGMVRVVGGSSDRVHLGDVLLPAFWRPIKK